MTSELRPTPVAWKYEWKNGTLGFFKDRQPDWWWKPNAVETPLYTLEAVRAEQAAELAKFKALAETLAGALELYAQWGGDTAREALRQYKEATNV